MRFATGLRDWVRRSVLLVVLVVLSIVLAAKAPHFATRANLLDVLRNVSVQGIVAFGMTLVIIAGEIDLSVGSVAAFAGCLAAWIVGRAGTSVPAVLGAMAAAVAAGAGCGALTGWVRMRFRVPTFITTLAWLTVLRGAAQLITGGFTLDTFPKWYGELGGGWIGGVPTPALVFGLVFVALYVLAARTPFGRAVYAVGGNLEAARLSGIKVERVKIGVLALVGALAAVSGLLLASRIQSGNSSAAQGMELEVISAVIIGGTSLMGGSGSIVGTLLGVVFLGVLVNGMVLLDINPYWQNVVRGALILGAVLLNSAPSQAPD